MVESPHRTIRYEAELDPGFADEMSRRIGDQSLRHCIQCGTCSSTCPVSAYMDDTPRRLVAMTREGFKEDVLKSITPWICASCYSCTVECPKEVKITELMYAIKRKAIEENAYAFRNPVPVLAKEFFCAVLRYGRIHEGRLMTRFLLKTHPSALFKNSGLGLRLFSKGRMEAVAGSIRNRKQLEQLLKAVSTPSPQPTAKS